ncbi:Sec-independent protein translocase protein TatB [Hellea balneolensis]|uniref:Sec-independent protein translocase protein TatB n=1 Tax=Hellea balneolensis TaxID=287478 RepID=UPI00040D1208|nr:Sec-independent protein translocase protein TatB [Hellea balneolensis]
MIPQFGFAEIVVLALLAIIVVGPKDLPKLMRTLGGFMAKVRAMGQEFKDAFADMDAEDEIAQMRKEIEELKNLGKLENLVGDDVTQEMRELDAEMRDATDLSSPKGES